MRLLLVIPTHVVAAMLYISAFRDMFHPMPRDAPTGWGFKLVMPVLIAGFTPLSLAAVESLQSKVRLILLVNVAAVLLVALTMMTALSRAKYVQMKVPMAILDREPSTLLTRANIALACAIACIVGGAAVNVWAVSHT